MALGFPVGIFAEEYVPATNRSFYLYGTYDIADSAGTLLPNTTLPGQQDTSSNISIIGCDLYSYNHTIDFDTSKRLVNYTQVPRLRDHSQLSAWQSQGPTAPEDLNILDLVRHSYLPALCHMLIDTPTMAVEHSCSVPVHDIISSRGSNGGQAGFHGEVRFYYLTPDIHLTFR